MEQEFHKKCGEILRKAIGIENTLEFFISNYFCHPQSYKTFFLNDILTTLGFERKIQIFKEICKRENIDKERIEKIANAVGFIQNIRNRVAHDEAYIFNSNEGIILQKRKSVIYKKNGLKITDELLKKIDREKNFSMQEIYEIYKELLEKFKS